MDIWWSHCYYWHDTSAAENDMSIEEYNLEASDLQKILDEHTTCLMSTTSYNCKQLQVYLFFFWPYVFVLVSKGIKSIWKLILT